MLPDGNSYLASSSIDKCFGSYKIEMPMRPMSPGKGGQMRSLMGAGVNRGQWGGAQSNGVISQSTSKFLNDYLKEREMKGLTSGDRNASCACFIF